MIRACSMQVLILALSGTLWIGCVTDNKPVGPVSASHPNAGSRSIIAVDIFEVKPGSPPSEDLISAVISVEGTALVLAQHDGILVQLNGVEGARTVEGEVLARLNDEDQRAQLRQAELEVDRLMVEGKEYEALINVNRSELEQENALFNEGLTSKRQVDRAKFRLEGATQELEKTHIATRAAQAKIEAAKLELQKSSVRAPIAGVVTRRYIKLGSSVVKNEKLFEISKLEPLEVRFQLPSGRKDRPGPGTMVRLSPIDGGRLSAYARIRRIDLVADAASDTLGYLADVEGRPALLPGIAVNVHVPRAKAASSLWIPRAAFPAAAEPRRGVANTILVSQGDRCAARAVWVTAIEQDQVEVSSGIMPGDRLILAPPADLKPGDQIHIKR